MCRAGLALALTGGLTALAAAGYGIGILLAGLGLLTLGGLMISNNSRRR